MHQQFVPIVEEWITLSIARKAVVLVKKHIFLV